MERHLSYAKIDVCPTIWKRILLGAIILAYKFWDNRAIWKVDYFQVLKDIITDGDINFAYKTKPGGEVPPAPDNPRN